MDTAKGLDGEVMNHELNERLELAQQGLKRLHKVETMLKELESELQTLEKHEKELKKVLEKENFDVEKLENKGFTAFLYSLLGTLDERIDKERSEALASKFKYDQAVKDIADIQQSIAKLNLERPNYLKCPEEYDSLYAQKRKILLEENGETAQQILNLTDEANRKRINLQEIKEAKAVGDQVLISLNHALKSLASAEGWGTWDLFGGGLLTDLAKHSEINAAQGDIDRAQKLLRQFKTELTDIQIGAELSLKTEGFVKFADFFFDGLIADWFMQSRINESQASVQNVKDQVLSIMSKLEDMKNYDQNQLQLLEEELNNVIVRA